MARKITDRERLITFVLNADDDQLSEAKELIDTALRNRAPKKVTRKASKRAPAVDLTTQRNPPPED